MILAVRSRVGITIPEIITADDLCIGETSSTQGRMGSIDTGITDGDAQPGTGIRAAGDNGIHEWQPLSKMRLKHQILFNEQDFRRIDDPLQCFRCNPRRIAELIGKFVSDRDSGCAELIDDTADGLTNSGPKLRLDGLIVQIVIGRRPGHGKFGRNMS